jgi:hypothetical protein
VRVGTSQGEDRVTEVTLEREQAKIKISASTFHSQRGEKSANRPDVTIYLSLSPSLFVLYTTSQYPTSSTRKAEWKFRNRLGGPMQLSAVGCLPRIHSHPLRLPRLEVDTIW